MAKSNVTKLLREERHLAKKAAQAAAEPEYALSEAQWTYFRNLAEQQIAQRQVMEGLISAAIQGAGLPMNASVDPFARTVTIPPPTPPEEPTE